MACLKDESEDLRLDCIVCHLLLKGHDQEGDPAAVKKMVTQVEQLFNRSLFGNDDTPSNWKLPIKDRVLGEVEFLNWHRC